MSIRIGDRIISGGGGGNGESLTNQNLSSDITQIYNWVGSYADYAEQDVANTHPDWVCYITDDEFGDEQEYEIVQYTARNVGDIFFTSRKDTWLNGAVECNGNTYSINDFEGNESIGELLKKNLVPYVSMSEYETLLSTNGVVGVFGWDGGENNQFRVPTLKDIFLEAGRADELGDYVKAGLPNITGDVTFYGVEAWNGGGSDAFKVNVSTNTSPSHHVSGNEKIPTLNFNASRSNSIYGSSDTVQPKAVKYRPMVQLSTGFNDEAIETCQNVKADVENLKGYDYVVDWQIPTSENGYTWYRKYKSGWVEQGGIAQAAGGGWSYVELLIEMANTSATVNVSVNWATTAQDGLKVPTYYMPSTTRIGILIHGRTGQSGIAYYSGEMSWQVSGIAA